MKKALRMMIVMIAVVLTANPSQAQKLIKKELKTENKEKDGFQFQWNMYTFVSGKDTLDAAFDLNGNRITPNGYKNGKQEGCFYAGGGMFSVKSKNRIPTGARRISVYNIKGECIIPDTNQDYFFIYYIGDGFFELTSTNILGQIVVGMYDYKGNCIIPEEWGFNSILYYDESELFTCSTEDSHGETTYSFSKDGNYYAEGFYGIDGEDYRGERFENNKRPVPNRKNNKNSAMASASNTSSNSSTTTSSVESGLLYEGDYTEGPWINPNTGYSQPAPNPHHHVKIYEDHFVIDMLNLSCSGKSSSGEKMFINSWGNITYYVDNFFNIRSTFPYGYSQFTKGNVVYDMNAPVQNYDDGDYNGGTKGTNGDYKGGQTRPSTKDCPVCHTTGNCQTCLGRGWVTGLDNQRHDCPTCHGNKVCWKCNGSGKVSTH